MLKGISTWLHQRRDWTIAIDERGLDDPAPDWLARWGGQGVITRLGEAALPPQWQGAERPVVFLRRVLAADPLSGVYTDDDAVMRLAVEHLADRGFRELAFCAVATDWSAARCEAFLRHAERAGFGVHVPDDGAAAAGVSRRLLDKKFQKHLGRTIHDEIMRTRLAEARRLLVETDHKLLVVAMRSGFAHAAQLCNLFKAAHGMSPMQYRKAARPWEA